jgi:hypothetical protein
MFPLSVIFNFDLIKQSKTVLIRHKPFLKIEFESK